MKNKVLISINALIFCLLTGVVFSQSTKGVKDPNNKGKAQTEQLKNEGKQKAKEAKENAAESKNEVKESSREMKEDEIQRMMEAKAQAAEARKHARQNNKEFLDEVSRNREELTRLSAGKINYPSKNADAYRAMDEEEISKLSPEDQKAAKQVKILDKMAESNARYAQIKKQVNGLKTQLEADKTSGKFTKQELLEKQQKIDDISRRVRETREKLQSGRETISKQ